VGQQKTNKRRCGPKQPVSIFTFFIVVMRHTCQVTNQSSHGELSFHHNPHLRPCWDLGLSTLRVIRRGGARLKNAAHPSYCHCCELCALKQKPGVLLEKNRDQFLWCCVLCVVQPHTRARSTRKCFKIKKIPTADRTHHRIRSPSIECSGT